jgi:hypothetical protein
MPDPTHPTISMKLPMLTRLLAFCLLIGWGCVDTSLGQSILHDDAESQSLQDKLLKPMSQIRLKHDLMETPDQVIPQPELLPAKTSSRAKPTPKSYRWVNSDLVYNRPYFEEYFLERHGCSQCLDKQPFISGARFYATATLLPVLPLFFPPRDFLSHRHW